MSIRIWVNWRGKLTRKQWREIEAHWQRIGGGQLPRPDRRRWRKRNAG